MKSPGTDENYRDIVYTPKTELRMPSLVSKKKDYAAQKPMSEGWASMPGI